MILVVDHYDSFTYNLVQLIESLGRDTTVVKSDERPAAELVAMDPEAVVLSPGPGHPRDAGCFTELLATLPDATPVLGVCLGHQALGLQCGGTVDRAEPVHGKASLVFHEGRGILEGVSVPFEAGRYHSLVRRARRPPGGAGADRLDRGRARHGHATPATAALRRPVPPGEHPHARGPADRRELPRPRRLRLPYGFGQPGPYANRAEPPPTRHARSSTATNALAGIRFSWSTNE